MVPPVTDLWTEHNVPKEQLWLTSDAGFSEEVSKTNFAASVPAKSPFAEKIGEKAWKALFVEDRFHGLANDYKAPSGVGNDIHTGEKLSIVIEMLAHQIDRGREKPLRDWIEPKGKPKGTEMEETEFEPSPVTKYLHLYMLFDYFGMTKAKNQTMKKMCQLVCKVNDLDFKYWTISKYDLKFILENTEVKSTDKIFCFVLDAACVNMRVMKEDTTFLKSLEEFAEDVGFLQKFLIHMMTLVNDVEWLQKLSVRVTDVKLSAPTRLEQLFNSGQQAGFQDAEAEEKRLKDGEGGLLEDEGDGEVGEDIDVA